VFGLGTKYDSLTIPPSAKAGKFFPWEKSIRKPPRLACIAELSLPSIRSFPLATAARRLRADDMAQLSGAGVGERARDSLLRETRDGTVFLTHSAS